MRPVMRLLFAALGVALATGQGTAAQPTRGSIQGVWRVVEAVITGPAARTIAFAERQPDHLHRQALQPLRRPGRWATTGSAGCGKSHRRRVAGRVGTLRRRSRDL